MFPQNSIETFCLKGRNGCRRNRQIEQLKIIHPHCIGGSLSDEIEKRIFFDYVAFIDEIRILNFFNCEMLKKHFTNQISGGKSNNFAFSNQKSIIAIISNYRNIDWVKEVNCENN